MTKRKVKLRPLIVTIERRKHNQPDTNGDVFPAGRPCVTNMRKMNWLEYQVHLIKGLFVHQPTWEELQTAGNNQLPLTLGVELSSDQYMAIIDSKRSAYILDILQDQPMSMAFVAPTDATPVLQCPEKVEL